MQNRVTIAACVPRFFSRHDPLMPTSDQNARPLSVRDAINYLDAIKDQNQDKPEVYNQFLDIIKDFRSEV